ncbi:MAG: hypothetical protein VX951_08970 [Planctomycetota bacterium]|nr:hypothetical protein [Planctomycetota bacterium]
MAEESMGEVPEVSPGFQIQAGGETPKAGAEVVQEEIRNVEGTAESPMNARQWADKYNSPEELEKGYIELQKKMSAGRPKTSEMDLEGLLNSAGLQGGDLAAQWVDQGKLLDHQYDALQQQGISRAVVDQFMRGQQAISSNSGYVQAEARAKAEALAGGGEELDNLFNWAGNRYASEPQKMQEINDRLGDPARFEGAVKELLYDYKVQSGRGFTTPLAEGTAMPNVSNGFGSVQEYLAAMRQAREDGFPKSFLRRLQNTPTHIKQGLD